MSATPEALARYAGAHTSAGAPVLAAVVAETAATAPTPQMLSGRVEAALLEALVVASGARRVLEIGTFTGHGALALAARLPEGGRVITVERNERFAAQARQHFGATPLGERIDLLVGDAREVVAGVDGPLDLVFVDAAKGDYLAYYEMLVPKLADRGVIVADNVLWGGAVVDGPAADPQTQALREFADRVHADPRVHNALLTVGDGLLLIWRSP